jgi:multidrug efflux system outer membrane protein
MRATPSAGRGPARHRAKGTEIRPVRSAKAQQQAVFSYQPTVPGASREPNDALTASQRRIEEVERQTERVAALRKFARLSKLEFDKGMVRYVEVLVAESELFAAKLASVRRLADRYIQVVNVSQAMGGGWAILADSIAVLPRGVATAQPAAT